jgi:hypothetical protein
MSQTKRASFVEAITNTSVGLLIAFAAQWFICWVYGIKLTPHDNGIIVFWMTVLSVVRSYVVRRVFNRKTDSRYIDEAYDSY